MEDIQLIIDSDNQDQVTCMADHEIHMFKPHKLLLDVVNVFKAYSFTYVVREVGLGCTVCLSLSILARERSLGITTF